ncbi:MAG: ABC transporter ATP-binding protein [Methylobacter sp.]|nr:MAG: ABC transporter ATP-binding protein [Methylobacter sp.]
MTTLVEADCVSRFYNKQCAVNDISFSLKQGEVLGFLGPNGAGKTTTMQMLCGNLAPSAGQIKINGFDIVEQPVSAKRYLGYLPDTPPLYKELTVEEFLIYCAKLHGLGPGDIKTAVTHAQERCGLSGVSRRLIGNLSKGYQQRAGIAQAIVHNPPVIILDEPTVGLDPIQIREIRALIRELGQDHGVILSTHILSEVQESCTHVQIIHQGKLVLKETIAGLHRHMNSGLIKLASHLAVPVDALQNFTGILSIELITPHIAHIRHDGNHNPAEEIAETVVNLGCGLLELTPIKKSMEEVFIQLTQEAGADE